MLIAVAQQHDKSRGVDFRVENSCCPDAVCVSHPFFEHPPAPCFIRVFHYPLTSHALFQPILVWITHTKVRFVRGHVPRSQLDALSDPTKAITRTLRLDISVPLDILDTEGQQRIVLALVAVLDCYFLHVRPGLFCIERNG